MSAASLYLPMQAATCSYLLCFSPQAAHQFASMILCWLKVGLIVKQAGVVADVSKLGSPGKQHVQVVR